MTTALTAVTQTGSNSDHLQRLPLVSERAGRGLPQTCSLFRKSGQEQQSGRSVLADQHFGAAAYATDTQADLVTGLESELWSIRRIDGQGGEAAVCKKVRIALQVLVTQHAGLDQNFQADPSPRLLALPFAALNRPGAAPCELAGGQVQQLALLR